MRGMTIEFAVTRVFELESKKDHPINRLMIDNYLSSLRRGMKKNQEDYFKVRNMDPSKGKQLMKETQKSLMENMSRIAFRQYEIKGYETMLERMLDQPLQGAISNNNTDLEQKLLEIKATLTQQQTKNRALEAATEKKVTETIFERELREALERKEKALKQDEVKKEVSKQIEEEESKGNDGDKEESEGESSYYDTEEGESEEEEDEKKTPVTIVNLSKDQIEAQKFKEMVERQIKEATTGIKKSDLEK